jgi:hypothetical protein
MINFSVVLLFMSLLLGCTGNEIGKPNNEDTKRGYFSDASKCRESAMYKEKINVNNSGVVEIPVAYKANAFLDCMKYTGWPVPRADPTEYLDVSTTCLKKAQGTENLDESYAECIRRSRLNIEVITDK